MKGRFAVSMVVLLLLAGLLLVAGPASALKVYVQPSTQTGNWSPDGTYCEAYAMQDVAVRLMAKLQARGFVARCGDWRDLYGGINDATAWGADCFVALHTNAWPAMGGTAHGSQGFYYSHNGVYDPADYDLAYRCSQKCKSKFSAWGVGYDGGAYGNDTGAVCVDAPGCHMLMEALYHDNTADLAVLRRYYGREAYAQAMYEAICDHYGWSYNINLQAMPTGPIASAPDGRMEFFQKGSNGQIYHCWQNAIDGSLSAWTSRGGSVTNQPTTARDYDGRVEVLVRGTDSQVWRKYQATVNGAWSTSWTMVGSGANIGSDLAVAMNVNGCLEIFARGNDNALWHCWQSSAGGSWGSWVSLGGNIRGTPAVARHADGRLDVFARDSVGVLYHIFQNTPAGGWSGWYSVGLTVAGDLVANRDADGRIELVVRGTANDIVDIWQTAINTNSWGWESMGGNATGQPALIQNGDGRLQVFIRDAGNYAIYERHQVTQNGGWSAWTSLGGYLGGSPMVMRNADGRLQVFCRGTNGVMYTTWMTSNGGSFSSWAAMGSALF